MVSKRIKEKFKTLKGKVSKATINAIKNFGFKYMTDIQTEVIPKALDGQDIVATAKTGSGKTLAFLIPVVEAVAKRLEKLCEGTCCLIISPTRELATQTYQVLQQLISYHEKITAALIIGGESRKLQENKLANGVHIVVATPGRLFDHMRTKEFEYKHVTCLVLDEADKIFQYGFEEDLKQIISRLPKDRQTMLFSATHTETTDALIKYMRNDLLSINTNEGNEKATVDGLKQGYVGKMNQSDRTATMTEFYETEKIALFCTDLAARGLDIPAVDWIVQFDPPADSNEYIHRVGRTARGLGAEGQAVLLLRPEEKEFINYLKEAKIYLDKYEVWDKLSNLQSKLNKAFEDPQFGMLAKEAFEGYIRAFEVKKLKHIFNLLTMDMNAVAKSLGLREKPDVDIRVGFSKKHRPRKRKAALLTTTGFLESTKHLKT
ncbi:unnamed protein product, partial [Iphiclides podalirius]